MRIIAVVLNWRRPNDTIECVRSVQQTSPDTDVIVVDNASGDGSVEAMRAALNDVTFIENQTNGGYASGNNLGIVRALKDGADAAFVLNNDVIVRAGCVQRLTEVLNDTEGIVAPVSLRADDPGICDFWRATVDVANLAVNAIGRDEAWVPPPSPEQTDYATGSALLIPRDSFGHAGPFDERFFLVWEDVDLCLMERRFGYPVLAVPDAEVLHAGSSSFGGAGSPLYQYFYVRNSFLIIDKHLRWPRKARTRAMITNRYRGGIERATDPAVRRAIERGLQDGLAGRFGPAPEFLGNLS